MEDTVELSEIQRGALQKALVELKAVETFQEGGELNGRVFSLRTTIERLMTTGTPETIGTFDWQQQYAESIATLRADGLCTFEPTLALVLGAFSTKQQEAIPLLRHPKLLLVPQVSFAAKVRAINSSGLVRYATHVNEDVFGSLSVLEEGDKEVATALRPVVIEAQKEMDVAPYDNLNDVLKNRIDAVHKNRSAHVGGTDRDTYAALQLHALGQGNSVDRRTWTILDTDEALKGNIVPDVGLRDDQVIFSGNCADDQVGFARFRSSVMGDVLQS